MDKVTLKPQMLKGTVCVPPSKSAVHRLLLASFLSGRKCKIKNVELSKDISAMLDGLSCLGAEYTYGKRSKTVTLKRTKAPCENAEIDCIESATVLRFLMPISLLFSKSSVLKGEGRLLSRPLLPYKRALEENGACIKRTGNAIEVSGSLKSGRYEICGNVSSQFISGLLFALPLLDGDSEIIVTSETESTGYIDMTLSVLKKFGIEIENRNYLSYFIKGGQSYKAIDTEAEGDWSQAAFFLGLDSLGCDIRCTGLDINSVQGDRAILDIIKSIGAKVIVDTDGIAVKRTAVMNGITVDAKDIPDLVPILAVILSFCDGESQIINAGRLRMKESDRLSGICDELRHLGADIRMCGDGISVKGVQVLSGNTVSARDDHRIAMALSVAASRCESETVDIIGGAEAVKKSYPDFFEIYKSLETQN